RLNSAPSELTSTATGSSSPVTLTRSSPHVRPPPIPNLLDNSPRPRFAKLATPPRPASSPPPVSPPASHPASRQTARPPAPLATPPTPRHSLAPVPSLPPSPGNWKHPPSRAGCFPVPFPAP